MYMILNNDYFQHVEVTKPNCILMHREVHGAQITI